MRKPKKNLIFDRKFLADFGTFHAFWLTLDLIVSYGIGKFLKIPHESTHILTSGMEFGRKATILRNLVYRSNDPQKAKITKLLGKMQNESKRNVFAHAVVISDLTEVTFIDRSRGGDYSATEHTFTAETFEDHVTEVMRGARELENLLAMTPADYRDFAMAALSAKTSATKSPVPPSSKAE